MSRLLVSQQSVNLSVVIHPYETLRADHTMANPTTTELHSHYYDYGYSDWACIECQNSTDYCPADAVVLSNETGCEEADRWPAGLPGNHPAHNTRNNAGTGA